MESKLNKSKNNKITTICLIIIIAIIFIGYIYKYNNTTTLTRKMSKFDFDYATVVKTKYSISNNYEINDLKKVEELYTYLGEISINKSFWKRVDGDFKMYEIIFYKNNEKKVNVTVFDNYKLFFNSYVYDLNKDEFNIEQLEKIISDFKVEM